MCRKVIFIVLTILFFSCKSSHKTIKKNINTNYDTTSYYDLQIQDSFIVNSVNKYIDYYKISPDSVWISVALTVNDYKKILEISHSIRSFETLKVFPSGYFIHKNFLVCFYTNMSVYNKNTSQIKREITGIASRKNIRLHSKITIYEPPPITFIKCKEFEYYEMNIGLYSESCDLPCGYSTEIKDGKILIKLEEWYKEYLKNKDK